MAGLGGGGTTVYNTGPQHVHIHIAGHDVAEAILPNIATAGWLHNGMRQS